MTQIFSHANNFSATRDGTKLSRATLSEISLRIWWSYFYVKLQLRKKADHVTVTHFFRSKLRNNSYPITYLDHPNWYITIWMTLYPMVKQYLELDHGKGYTESRCCKVKRININMVECKVPTDDAPLPTRPQCRVTKKFHSIKHTRTQDRSLWRRNDFSKTCTRLGKSIPT